MKKKFGRDITFWGGGIDTQNLLQNGTKELIERQVAENIEILAPGGGFIFCPVHIVQPNVPAENIIFMVDALKKYGSYI